MPRKCVHFVWIETDVQVSCDHRGVRENDKDHKVLGPESMRILLGLVKLFHLCV